MNRFDQQSAIRMAGQVAPDLTNHRILSESAAPGSAPDWRRHVALLCLLVVCAGSCQPAPADVSVRRRAVEVLQLKDGTRLYGVSVQNQQEDTVRFLLRATWLREHAPNILAAAEQHPISKPESSEIVIRQLQQHIETVRTADRQNIERIGYLEERLAGLRFMDDSREGPDVVILRLPAKLVRQHLRKKTQFQQLAGLGILNGLTTVESASADDVEAELRELDPGSLIRNLPAESPAQDNQVLRLILLNADRMPGRTCRLIRQSGRYISEADADPQTLALQMLSGQMQRQLQQLLQEGPAGAALIANDGNAVPAAAILPRQAAEIARREQADVVELSQMELDAAAGTANVSIAVYHRLPDEADWKRVVSVSAAADRTDITDEQQQHIADDPRVQQVTQLFRGLGVRGTDLAQAVSVGAVVETAQQRAKERLAAQLQLQGPMAAQRLRVLEAELQELPPPAAP